MLLHSFYLLLNVFYFSVHHYGKYILDVFYTLIIIIIFLCLIGSLIQQLKFSFQSLYIFIPKISVWVIFKLSSLSFLSYTFNFFFIYLNVLLENIYLYSIWKSLKTKLCMSLFLLVLFIAVTCFFVSFVIFDCMVEFGSSQWLRGKESTCNAWDVRDANLISCLIWNSAFRWVYLSFLLCLLLLFFSQLFVRSPQIAIFLFCISFSWGWSWFLSPVQCHKLPSIVHQVLCLSDLVP